MKYASELAAGCSGLEAASGGETTASSSSNIGNMDVAMACNCLAAGETCIRDQHSTVNIYGLPSHLSRSVGAFHILTATYVPTVQVDLQCIFIFGGKRSPTTTTWAC
jgi:hypothetical protein